MIERAAAGAGLELKAHPHMLRHACGVRFRPAPS
jgi:site-specific recombinase XerD